MDITIKDFQSYLEQRYDEFRNTDALFMKLVEEMGELAEVLNKRNGWKASNEYTDQELAYEIADIVHYILAIASIQNIDLTKTILEKDKAASIKYGHSVNLESFLIAQKTKTSTVI